MRQLGKRERSPCTINPTPKRVCISGGGKPSAPYRAGVLKQ